MVLTMRRQETSSPVERRQVLRAGSMATGSTPHSAGRESLAARARTNASMPPWRG